jgi:hypothetical protein
MQITRFLHPLVLVAFLCLPIARAEEQAEPPFQPVWDLLNRQEKQQFISGYLFGMRDAATMTGVLDDFVRDNPNSARESVQRIKGIYEDMASGKPDALTREIDAFYKNPRNRQAPLSRAITAARNQL